MGIVIYPAKFKAREVEQRHEENRRSKQVKLPAVHNVRIERVQEADGTHYDEYRSSSAAMNDTEAGAWRMFEQFLGIVLHLCEEHPSLVPELYDTLEDHFNNSDWSE